MDSATSYSYNLEHKDAYREAPVSYGMLADEIALRDPNTPFSRKFLIRLKRLWRWLIGL